MATLGNNVKTAFFKGMEAVGKAGAGLVGTAQQKLKQMNVDARRGELRREIPAMALELWKEGVEMPERLNALVKELGELEEELAAMRAQPEPEKPEEESKAETEEASDETAETAEGAEAAPQEEQCDQLKEELQKASQRAGEAVGSAMDAVGNFMEGAIKKVGEMVDTFQKKPEEAEPPVEEPDTAPEETGSPAEEPECVPGEAESPAEEPECAPEEETQAWEETAPQEDEGAGDNA